MEWENRIFDADKRENYEVISIEKGGYRIKDDSGEDYLYPPEKFEKIKGNSL